MAEWVLFNGSLQGAIVNHWDSLKVIAFAIAMLTTALTSAYILWLYKRVFFGVVPETLKNVKDASGYVIITMGILAAFTLILGLYPDLFYKSIINYVENLYNHTNGIALIKQKTTSANLKVSENLSENKNNIQKEKFLQVGSQLESTFPFLNNVKI
jgi:NADH:ubiquinone oxidoreductase subunit 4 (subunit M)